MKTRLIIIVIATLLFASLAIGQAINSKDVDVSKTALDVYNNKDLKLSYTYVDKELTDGKVEVCVFEKGANIGCKITTKANVEVARKQILERRLMDIDKAMKHTDTTDKIEGGSINLK